MNEESRMKDELRKWIAAKNGKIEADQISDETAIIEQRIISSLQIMDLILFLEKLTETPVEVESLKPGAFKNIDSIYRNFCKEPA